MTKCFRTLWMIAQSLQHICSLANRPFRLVQHIEQETKFAQQAYFTNACAGCMLKGQIPDDRRKMHNLEKGIGVGV